MSRNSLDFNLVDSPTLKDPPSTEAQGECDLNEKREEMESSEPKIYAVSELNHYVRQLLEGEFPQIWVQGEISNFKAHSSGHFYFSLKDEKSQMNAVSFRGFNAKLKFIPKNGMEVLIRGKLTVYEPRGTYQIFCQSMEPLGAGALQQSFNQLKEKLKKEGLFSQEDKKPLPHFPQHVALVTSPTGAAVRDILNVLGRRFKGLKITVVPVLVQGKEAPESIVQGLKKVKLMKSVDVVIVARGGGSMEDLWSFNDEDVARAIFDSKIPVVSAVGHEVDFTIADFVADVRAATPSVAAELVVKSVLELNENLSQLQRRLQQTWKQKIIKTYRHIQHLQQRLIDPQRTLQDLSLRCDEWGIRLERAMERWIKDRRTQIIHFASLMDSLSPLKVLDRGYAVVTSEKGIVYKHTDIAKEDNIQIQLSKGGLKAKVIEVNKGGPYGL